MTDVKDVPLREVVLEDFPTRVVCRLCNRGEDVPEVFRGQGAIILECECGARWNFTWPLVDKEEKLSELQTDFDRQLAAQTDRSLKKWGDVMQWRLDRIRHEQARRRQAKSHPKKKGRPMN